MARRLRRKHEKPNKISAIPGDMVPEGLYGYYRAEKRRRQMLKKVVKEKRAEK